MKVKFTTMDEAIEFAEGKNIPYFRAKTLLEMNSRELFSLRINQQWVLGLNILWTNKIGSEFNRKIRSDYDFTDITSFIEGCKALGSRRYTVINGMYCYQLNNNPGHPVYLESLDKMCLDQQLTEYTGNRYSVVDFCDEDDEKALTAKGVIVHKRTGQRFIVPGPEMSRYL